MLEGEASVVCDGGVRTDRGLGVHHLVRYRTILHDAAHDPGHRHRHADRGHRPVGHRHPQVAVVLGEGEVVRQRALHRARPGVGERGQVEAVQPRAHLTLARPLGGRQVGGVARHVDQLSGADHLCRADRDHRTVGLQGHQQGRRRHGRTRRVQHLVAAHRTAVERQRRVAARVVRGELRGGDHQERGPAASSGNEGAGRGPTPVRVQGGVAHPDALHADVSRSVVADHPGHLPFGVVGDLAVRDHVERRPDVARSQIDDLHVGRRRDQHDVPVEVVDHIGLVDPVDHHVRGPHRGIADPRADRASGRDLGGGSRGGRSSGARRVVGPDRRPHRLEPGVAVVAVQAGQGGVAPRGHLPARREPGQARCRHGFGSSQDRHADHGRDGGRDQRGGDAPAGAIGGVECLVHTRATTRPDRWFPTIGTSSMSPTGGHPLRDDDPPRLI